MECWCGAYQTDEFYINEWNSLDLDVFCWDWGRTNEYLFRAVWFWLDIYPQNHLSTFSIDIYIIPGDTRVILCRYSGPVSYWSGPDGDNLAIHESYLLTIGTQFASHCGPLLMLLLSSTLLHTHPTSTTLFPVLSKQSVLVLSFEYLTDNSMVIPVL
jgi:hypothetical protein